MSKLTLILLFVKPALMTAATILRNKDTNSTGVDDEAANAIDYLLERLAAYESGGPTS